MKTISFTAIATGLASGALAAAAIALASPAMAESGGTVALPGPVPVYPQNSVLGGANPYVPFGTDPSVPYGVWNQN
ncbi:hypothetical protein [Mycobacterium sp. OTB74]|jgi:hypothetical protein|uniref:hypothetical protein n=1 Tax=Mycobacterium sp. OTB74 TaxID=1853452 RepID=UPI0024767D1F|nr:hypothetical protein [Mycobacterium sp. OTB74]MDH6244318.1 hypothetical protein [Mycobacterium sp. OTB74]